MTNGSAPMTFDPRLVAGLTVCHGFSGDQLTRFVAACVPAQVPGGALLIARGDIDTSMLFVREGEVELFVGDGEDEILVRELRRGDHAGAAALLNFASTRVASARSRGNATLLILERDAFLKLEEEGHPFGSNLETDLLQTQVRGVREILVTLARVTRGGRIPEQVDPAPLSFVERVRSMLGNKESGDPDRVSGVDLLRSLGAPPSPMDAIMKDLGATLRKERVPAGCAIMNEGGEERDQFVVAQGRVGRFLASRRGGHVHLGDLEPGELGGIEVAVDNGPPAVSYVAQESSLVVRIPHGLCADAVIMRDPQSRAFRRVMLQSLATSEERLGQLLLRAVRREMAGANGPPPAEHQQMWRRAREVTARMC